MDFDKIIRKRRSVRSFSKKTPNWRKIITAIDSARFIPRAGGNYTLKFILVSDKEKIKNLSIAAQQDFIEQAQYVVVVCTNPRRLNLEFGERAKIYSRQQAGAAIQNFLLKITQLGLSSCWVSHFAESQIKEILKIPQEIEVEAILPIGYDAEKHKTNPQQIDLDSLLYFNKYKNKRMSEPNKNMDV